MLRTSLRQGIFSWLGDVQGVAHTRHMLLCCKLVLFLPEC